MSDMDKIVFGLLVIVAVIGGVWWSEHHRAAADACMVRGGVYVDGYCIDMRAVR